MKAIGKGLSKIMSKMGVSTYMSYCGAQLFEAIGLDKPLVDKYFRGTASQVGGIGVFEVALSDTIGVAQPGHVRVVLHGPPVRA